MSKIVPEFKTVWTANVMSQSKKKALPADPEPRVFLSLVEIAAKLGIAETTLRRLVWSETVVSRTKTGSKAIEIDVMTLPAKHKAALIARHPDLVGGSAAEEAPEEDRASLYTRAPHASVRRRADLRLEAILSYQKARATRDESENLADVERRWERNWNRSHPELKLAVRSVKRWVVAFASEGLNGLVDRNDGTQHKGQRIPSAAKQYFRDLYLRPHRPNLKLCYNQVVKQARIEGWGPLPGYHTFRRYACSLPKLVRALHRDAADTSRSVLPHVQRDPTSIPVMHTIQSDHRFLDVPVRCDKGCPVCTGRKPKGHFPIWTAWVDVRSRRILTTDLGIDRPTSERVLGGARRIISENGLPKRFYIDNGSDYVKAFGRRLRKEGQPEWDGPSEEALAARFAPLGVEVTYSIPGNPMGKGVIERMFRTFRHRFDEQFEAYRGKLGSRSKKAEQLFFNPAELPTLSELAYLLQIHIEEYNDQIVHTGRGMDGRTPSQVFFDESLRLPRHDPEPGAFGLIFFEMVPGGRLVGPLGIRYDNRIYRLSSLEKQLQYHGVRVGVRIDPDDQRVAVLTDPKTGAYICDARVPEVDATYDTRDEVTRAIIRQTFANIRKLRGMAADLKGDEGASQRVAEYARALIAHYKEQRAARNAEAVTDQQTGTGPTMVLAPGLSKLSRDRERAAVDPGVLTSEELAFLLAEDGKAPTAAPAASLSLIQGGAAEIDNDDDLAVVDEIRRSAEGRCLIDFCDQPVGLSGVLCAGCEAYAQWNPPSSDGTE